MGIGVGEKGSVAIKWLQSSRKSLHRGRGRVWKILFCNLKNTDFVKLMLIMYRKGTEENAKYTSFPVEL